MVRDSDGGGIVMVGDCSLGLEIVVGRKEEGGGRKVWYLCFFPLFPAGKEEFDYVSPSIYFHVSFYVAHVPLQNSSDNRRVNLLSLRIRI